MKHVHVVKKMKRKLRVVAGRINASAMKYVLAVIAAAIQIVVKHFTFIACKTEHIEYSKLRICKKEPTCDALGLFSFLEKHALPVFVFVASHVTATLRTFLTIN